jgi:single-stranded-DNA-specific exonuclease
MAPVFFTENIVDNGTGKPVGNSKEHLKLNLLHEDEPYKSYPAIGFSLANYYSYISKGYPFDICYCIDENEYRGNVNLQLKLKDIKPEKQH